MRDGRLPTDSTTDGQRMIAPNEAIPLNPVLADLAQDSISGDRLRASLLAEFAGIAADKLKPCGLDV